MKDTLYVLYRMGGSIGEIIPFHFKHGVPIYTETDKDILKSKCKVWNAARTPGEKSYYGIKYHVKPIDSYFNKYLSSVKDYTFKK